MSDSPNPTSPEPGGASRSTLVGVVVVVGLLLLAGGIIVANMQGGGTEPVGKGPLVKNNKSKGAKMAKNKGKGKGKAGKVALDELMVTAPDFERPAAPAGAKNVVIVVPTSVRKDHISPYGADPQLTPFLTEVAGKGARFSDVISAGPFAKYATWAAFTGQHPASFGAVEPGDAQDLRVMPDSVETMTEVFRASGWNTFGVTANFNLNTATGFAQGFDRFRDAQPNGFAPDARLEGTAAVAIAIELLKSRTPAQEDRPTFLLLDLVEAHQPQRNVKELMERFQPDVPNASYRAAVFRTDSFVKDLWSGLATAGMNESNTYLVVIGDHGEGLDEPKHHGKAHGRYLYESSVAIPWIVMGPGVAPGRVVDGIASSTDVMPTTLALAGLKAPVGIDGQSWADALTTGAPKTTRVSAISDSWYFEANRAAIFSSTTACQKDFGSQAMEHDTFVDGCFDRRTDPTFLQVKPIDPLMAELEKWRATVTPKVMEIPANNVPEGARQAGGQGKAGGKAPSKGGGKAPGKAKNEEG